MVLTTITTRNGNKNRFYKVTLDNGTFNDSSIVHFSAPRSLVDISDEYFVHHSKYIRISIMPSWEKAEYISRAAKPLDF